MSDEIMVSICCLSYNHEKYLRQCLDGIVNQKTNFKFEAIVHDDASTDNSQAIIREYEEKYPDIIKPIYQTENQYSQGKKISKDYVFPKVKGKYIALCEGDDFWCDENKLQKQFNALENNPNCNMSIHLVKGISEDGSDFGRNYPNFSIKSGVLSSRQLLDYICTNDYVFQTSSFFCKSSEIVNKLDNVPKFVSVSSTGDTAILLRYAAIGDIYYINDEMSCYRHESVSSIERRNKYNNTEEKIVAWFNKQIQMMEEYDKYTNGIYHDLCQRKINGYHFDRAVRNNNYKEMLKSKYKYFRKDYSFKYLLKLHLMAYFPKTSKRIFK